MEFKKGDRICWNYLHHFNSKSRAMRTKHGVFLGVVKHRAKYYQTGEQLCTVKFDGNKGTTRVDFGAIFHEADPVIIKFKEEKTQNEIS